MTEPRVKKVKPQPQMAKIVKYVKETRDTCTLRLLLEKPFVWRPGQFIMIRALIDGESVRRAYSVSSSPTKDYLEVTIRQTEEPTMSKYLNDRKEGDELEVKGPYGRFIWTPDVSTKLVCLGAGSGITPFRAFFEYIIDNELENDMKLLYSCGYGDNVIFKDELENLVAKTKNGSYELSITRDPMELNSIRKGRINSVYLQQEIKGYEKANFYICGAPGFVKHMIAALQEVGVARNQIKREQWG
ncbi:MAG: hypothetical protein IH840_02640 [Candidatus Heimdallarchaeota archaeon]|nr:hypothetical protein [Candidatus Heimdallarchaeota archaeon]